ncbi:hypothetical protein HDEF_0872 [Candidatus Hamiltonella defensa 5AT (Acyrthosiphon pisum)]|uniref:Uncharacterized protein n=1 Tax=Hamiltonella defensa subsp. Acyrthosiphon pisum (strain 5AT) TaxID=572265 RepID=C4K4U8_HAMD5|nr:hypothetical protein HDEF_0872 [Candidatus Hamiltonella defensa 5AT (Acyrthosiphon pisum)]
MLMSSFVLPHIGTPFSSYACRGAFYLSQAETNIQEKLIE